MVEYIYKCFGCGKEFNSKLIESEFHYLCPECGSSEKNQPLNGVLEIEYDYNNLKKELSRKQFLNYTPGKFWLFPELWPLNFARENHSEIVTGISDNKLERLALNSSSYLEFQFENCPIFILDETRNPTLSYKDRASIITAIKGVQLGVKEIAAASTGNAGSSLAGICARLGITSHIFVPIGIPDAKRVQIQSFGAKIYKVDGSYDNAFDLCLEVSNERKWYNRNTAFNPLTIEGKKSAAFDIFISCRGEIPDTIFVPVGDGVIISGIYKGFRELLALGWIERIPRLIGVQAQGSDALVRYLETGKFEFIPDDTVADSISAGAPRNLYMAADAVKVSGGKAITVSDEEIISAQKFIAKNYGILSEPSSAASLAGYIKLKNKNEINQKDKVLLLITGNGLKDTAPLEKWNQSPPALSYDEWLQKLITK
jgi:threonine synthase